MHALRSPASGWMYARPSLILRPRAPWADMVSWAVSLVRSQRFGIDAIVPRGLLWGGIGVPRGTDDAV